MPISRKTIESATKRLTVSFDLAGEKKETVEISYHPGKLTPEFSNLAANPPDNMMEAYGLVLTPLLADWDLYDDDAFTQKTPITAEVVSALPLNLLQAMYGGILEDAFPSKKSGGSFGGSSTQEGM